MGAESSPVVSLSLVLSQTVSALGLGYLCVRAKYINPAKGDLGALRFYVAWIGLPLSVFSRLATVDLRGLDWGVVAACNLAKIVTWAITFAMTYVAYRSQRSPSQRLLTANTFAFFVVASNDLAIGFPIIQAMYGPSMEGYITANLSVYLLIFQPMTMVVYEVGLGLRSIEEGAAGASMPALICKVWRGLSRNLVIIATVLGAFYQVLLGQTGLLGQTVWLKDGKAVFPSPLQEIVAHWTAPFSFFFLFTNGVAIKEMQLGFWSSLLVLMKVVACAYIGFLLCSVFLPSGAAADLKNFTFFYGSIPTGGAPLVLAELFDPSSVAVVAAAGLWCIVLSAPIELVTALFIENRGIVSQHVVHVQQVVANASLPASVLVLALLALMRRTPVAAVDPTVWCYAIVACAYHALTVSFHAFDLGCRNYPMRTLFGFLQILCSALVLLLQSQVSFLTTTSPKLLGCTGAFCLLVALVLPFFNTFDEVCTGPGVSSVSNMALLAGWDALLLLATCVLTARGVSLKRQRRESQLADPGAHRWGSVPRRGSTGRLASEVGGFAAPLVVLQVTRLVMEVVNLIIRVMGRREMVLHGFTPMAIVVNVAEHGQGVALLLVILLNGDMEALQHMVQNTCCRRRRLRLSSDLPVAFAETESEDADDDLPERFISAIEMTGPADTSEGAAQRRSGAEAGAQS